MALDRHAIFQCGSVYSPAYRAGYPPSGRAISWVYIHITGHAQDNYSGSYYNYYDRNDDILARQNTNEHRKNWQQNCPQNRRNDGTNSY